MALKALKPLVTNLAEGTEHAGRTPGKMHLATYGSLAVTAMHQPMGES
jgi:hypothetical protein